MLNPGRLKHLATFEGMTRTDDDTGGYTESWGEVVRAWVEYEPLQGREQIEAMQTQAGVTGRIRMRYRRDISPEMRLTFDGRVFTIVGGPFSPGERGEELELLVVETITPAASVES